MHRSSHRNLLVLTALVLLVGQSHAQNDLGAILKQEGERVGVVEKIKPAVVAVFARGGQGGGSGVLINDEGYALTNFHVVQPTGPTMQCGLADGVLYDAVLVGLDKVGDVALIKLLGPKAGHKFPFAKLGDSDKVREGDWSIAAGNPFLLATDFTPTFTFGLVSGVHRYQPPAGTFLEYTDCIQIDTSINPGNSGGPLFNIDGDLIGINGRGSFDKRGRVNSGVGYAISINQIKNFLGHMRAGLDTDHASLGALITTQTEQTGIARMVVTSILEESDIARRGMDLDDELVSFAGRTISSVNHFKNVMGLYPRGWRVPLEFRHEQKRQEVLVRLMGIQRKVIEDEKPKVEPKKIVLKGPAGAQGPAAKLYEAKAGFANHYFNKLERERLMADVRKLGDFTAVGGNWSLEGNIRLKKLRAESKLKVELVEKKEGASSKTIVKMNIDAFPYELDPLKDQQPEALKMPETSGGFLAAMFVYHQFLTQGDKVFTEFTHGGHEPIYPPPIVVAEEGKETKPLVVGSNRVDTEVINSRLGPYLAKWYFALPEDKNGAAKAPANAGKLLALEVRLQDNEDPCEVYFSDYRPVDGRQLPHRLQVLYGNGTYGTMTFDNFRLAAAAK